MTQIPKAHPLPQITHEQQLPDNVRELGRIIDTLNHHQLFVFYENNHYLSICDIDNRNFEDGEHIYHIFQIDFPLAFLRWFPYTLHQFRLPPGKNPYPRFMSTDPEDVAGEFLSIDRAMAAGGDTSMPGYIVNNWSRSEDMSLFDDEDPSSINFIESFLFQGGLLDFMNQLAKQLEKEGKL